MKRVRRTPEDARRLILDAAERCMATDGPGGLRLMSVAQAAGVSHPTILHHFGSREGLVQALNRRTVDDLKQMLLGLMRTGPGDQVDLVGPVFEAYRNGLAQRVAWLLQAEPGQTARTGILEEIVAELHAFRIRHAEPGAAVDEDDTRAFVHLSTVVAFGDAILGPTLRNAADPAEELAMRARFEDWFRRLISR